MSIEWIHGLLSSACESIDYGFTASASNGRIGPKFLRITDIVSGRIDWDSVPHVNVDDTIFLKFKIEDGDIVVARTGASTGNSCYIKSPPRAVFASYLVRLKAKPEFHPRYLAYYLKSKYFWDYVNGVLGDKSAQPNASASTITKAPLHAPMRRKEQEGIADVLGTLDDKIELNRKTNATLEAMAKALFKSWFVNFAPVRAKAEGRDTGLPSHLADLFPESLEDSELGEIPKGWTVGSLLEQAQLLSGGTPRTDRPEYWHGSIPWASAKDVSQCGSCFLISTERAITKLGLQDSATQIIPAFSTVVVARGATTGRMTLFGTDIAMNQTCYALRSTLECNFALYCKARQVMDNLVQTAHGSVFDTITTSTFQASRVVLAPPDVIHRFEHMSEPLFRQILTKEYESKSLATLRDTLLPKLISGELRASDSGDS